MSVMKQERESYIREDLLLLMMIMIDFLSSSLLLLSS